MESLGMGQGVGESLEETSKDHVWSLSVACREREFTLKTTRTNICKGLSIFFLVEEVTKSIYSPGRQRPSQGRCSLREKLPGAGT